MRLTPLQLTTLADMHSYCRPHGSGGDHLFRAEYLHPLGTSEDVHGNLHLTIGDSPILWSSHTDTVHRDSGWQSIHVDRKRETISLSRRARRTSSCLGADDTIGVFLMREMILRGVPGHYVFHYGEEAGAIGSGDLAKHSPHLLGNAQFAIAFDRKGTQDIITYQMSERCCSDAFVSSLALQLPGYKADPTGVFTDTAEYTRLIPECTNISVGYYHQHSNREYVDYAHVGVLLSHLCELDASSLVCERDPAVKEYEGYDDAKWEKWFDRYYPATPRSTSRTPLVLCASSDDWCDSCDRPILTDDDWDYFTERCECRDDYTGMSSEDAQFLRYLRAR